MIASFIDLAVHILLSLLAVKLIFFRSTPESKKTKEDSVSWKSAVDAMEIMETRLSQLSERDLKLQEKIWCLEDVNRDLQNRLFRVTKELLLANKATGETGPDFDINDDEEDEQINSIPPN